MATSAGGLPYVETSDLVSGYPAVSELLAETLDTQLAAKADTASLEVPGLKLISAQSGISGSSAIVFNNVFSATYDTYRILMDLNNGAVGNFMLRMRAAGTNAEGATSYKSQRLTATGTTVAAGANDTTNWYICAVGPASKVGLVLDVFNPATAEPTIITGHGYESATVPSVRTVAGIHQVSTAYDGFYLFTDSGSTMSGDVAVYGYRKA
jgi:hypothetical protein